METSTDGTGLRNSVYFQGCSIRCPQCHNKETWNPSGGSTMTVEELVTELDTEFVSGISILGGEPTDQQDGLIELLKQYKTRCPNKTIWLYTGHTLEHLKEHKPAMYSAIIEFCDTVVDGPYQSYQGEHCKFRGSPNQRIIKISNHEVIYS